jgi:hypothetical protein
MNLAREGKLEITEEMLLYPNCIIGYGTYAKNG